MVVSSVDYTNRRIYLSSSTVDTDLDTLDVYREVRALRRTDESHRKFKPMLISGGNIRKTTTSYTLPYVQLLYGCRIVPYNTSHMLRVIRETFTDDGKAGRDCFDRYGLSSTVEVDIDYDIERVEIKIVSVGGSALTTEEHDQLFEVPTVTQAKKLILERHNTVVDGEITNFIAGSGDVSTPVTVVRDADGIPLEEVLS